MMSSDFGVYFILTADLFRTGHISHAIQGQWLMYGTMHLYSFNASPAYLRQRMLGIHTRKPKPL